MIEFVIALLAKRHHESRIIPVAHDNRKNCPKTPKSRSRRSNFSEVVLDIPYKRYPNGQVKRALFNSFFHPSDQVQDCEKDQVIDKPFPKKTCQNTVSNKLDVGSAILFPFAYAIFNVIYWYYVM